MKKQNEDGRLRTESVHTSSNKALAIKYVADPVVEVSRGAQSLIKPSFLLDVSSNGGQQLKIR